MRAKDFLVAPGGKIRLSKQATAARGEYADEDRARAQAQAQSEQLSHYQKIIEAHASYGILIVLQGMDAAGKDETIQTVLSALDPQSCQARSFKSPTSTERQHDYLWRAVQALPRRGEVVVFNRSYYEQVTSEQVYPELVEAWGLPPEARENLWEKRYAQINNFERHLAENGFVVLKFFLHIAQETERLRLLERTERPDLQHELSETDLRHHQDWDAFQQTYEAMLNTTSTSWAPWYLIPADQRSYTYAAIASVLVERFKELHSDYPPLDEEMRQLLERARGELSRGEP